MTTRFVVDQQAVDALGKDPKILAGLREVAEAAAARMRKRAPANTGRGAASIHVEPDPDGFRIGWDRQHYYMSFQEFGTEDEPARPFMRPTVDEFNRH